MTRHRFDGPVDLDALDVWNLRNAASRLEYRRAPHVGNFSGYRAPCTRCATPTYSKHGVCRACRKDPS